MKIAIIGFGQEGRAAYDYWHVGNEITICDQNEAVITPDGTAKQLGANYLQNLDVFDLIVRSPFVHPRLLVETAGPEILEKVTTNTNEFLKVCPTRNVIGVTGTKGKGTTSTLIAEMLKSAGKTVHLGGNIGVAPLEMFKQTIAADDWVVLELSSFQLIDLKHAIHIAICLMVAPEHLDWHEDFEEYLAAKQQLFMNQGEQDTAIYFADNDNSVSIADASIGQQIPYFAAPGAWVSSGKIVIDDHELCSVTDLKLLGEHNWQNVCAAVTAVWQVSQDTAAITSVLTSFSGLEHRLEFVQEVNGVKYYDDSFGTTPETAIVALQAFEEPKVVILGGSDKGADYDELAEAVTDTNVRHALLIGDQAARIQSALERAGFKSFSAGGTTMPEIVKNAAGVAESGDVVLLSTGCASFDLFANYKDRGEQFSRAVQALSSVA